MTFLAAGLAKSNPSGINDGPFYVGLGFVLIVGTLLAVIGFVVGFLGTTILVTKKKEAEAKSTDLCLR